MQLDSLRLDIFNTESLQVNCMEKYMVITRACMWYKSSASIIRGRGLNTTYVIDTTTSKPGISRIPDVGLKHGHFGRRSTKYQSVRIGYSFGECFDRACFHMIYVMPDFLFPAQFILGSSTSNIWVTQSVAASTRDLQISSKTRHDER